MLSRSIKRTVALVLCTVMLFLSSIVVNADESVSAPTSVDKFDYYFAGDTAVITGFWGDDTDVVIPAYIEGMPVTKIDNSAFGFCDDIESVIIPDGVLSIDYGAFYRCENLKTVVIPESVTYIDDSAFYYCESLESVYIPSSVTCIGECAFAGCSSLNTVVVNENNPVYDSRDNCNAIIETATDTLVVGSYATVIPENIKTIGESAFYGCTNLTTVTLPDSISTIDEEAFSDCYSLTSIDFPETLDSIGISAFADCSALKEIDIPESVDSIGACAFYDCSNLEKVVLREGLGAIGTAAFAYCDKISEITLPEGVTEITENAFYYCYDLEKVYIPDSVTSIGYSAFEWCYDLEFIRLPAALSYVGDSAFYGCDYLDHVFFAGTEEQWKNTEIGSDNYNLENVTIHFNTDNTIESAESLAPTCTEDGYDMSKCTVCGKKYIVTYPKHDLSYESMEFVKHVEKTCTINGYDLYKCNLCNEYFEKNIIYAYGHNFTDDTCDYCGINNSYLAESSHPYESNCDNEWVISMPGASELSFCFSDSTLTEYGYDFIEIYDADNDLVGRYTGDELKDAIVAVKGDRAVVRLTSDSSFECYGFKIVDVVPGYSDASPDESQPSTEGSTEPEPSTPPVTAPVEPSDDDYNPVKIEDEVVSGSGYYSDDNYPYTISYPERNCVYIVDNDLYEYNVITGEFSKVENYGGYDGIDTLSRFIAGNKIYNLNSRGFYNENDNKYYYYNEVVIYDLDTMSFQRVKLDYPCDFYAVGADAQGRVYAYGVKEDGSEQKCIYLFDKDFNLLSVTDIESEIYEFIGFDDSTDNFYTRSYYNFIYWGYDHDVNAVRIGNVADDNSINYNENIICMLSQQYYNEREQEALLIDNKYLAVNRSIESVFDLMDVEGFDINGQSISTIFEIERPESDSDPQFHDSLGARVAYFKYLDALLVCTDYNTITQYNLKTGEVMGSFKTDRTVYSIVPYNDELVIMEKEEDDFYLSVIPILSDYLSVTVEPESIELAVGEKETFSVSSTELFTAEFDFKSENPKVASVSERGEVFGWGVGTTNIIVSANGVVYARIPVTVSDNPEIGAASDNKVVKSRLYNKGYNNYYTYSSVVTSYMFRNADGSISLVSADNEKVYIDTYSSDFSKSLSEFSVNNPLDYFGGFYSGIEFNYLVFGKLNFDEKDENEVVRVQKYSKSWELLDSVSICGENTTIPFDAGSLRMVETNGLLYIHTCHEMYTSDDGYNHQANMTFVIDIEKFECIDKYTDVMNISYGYVSHSFNQFIASDDNYVFRVDHGDAYPRGISIVRTPVGEDITNVSCVVPIEFSGEAGNNTTGASVGGLELSENNVIVVGNKYVGDDIYAYNRNIFVCITNKEMTECNLIDVTNYKESDSISVSTPQLVKIGEDQFLLMWEEYDRDAEVSETKMVTFDSQGELTSDIVSTNAELSDCQPVVSENGRVMWFVSDDKSCMVYNINPFKLKELARPIGDVNSDSKVNVKDATEIQKYLANLTTLDSSSLLAADADRNSKINIKDATLIQKYSAKLVDSL